MKDDGVQSHPTRVDESSATLHPTVRRRSGRGSSLRCRLLSASPIRWTQTGTENPILPRDCQDVDRKLALFRVRDEAEAFGQQQLEHRKHLPDLGPDTGSRWRGGLDVKPLLTYPVRPTENATVW